MGEGRHEELYERARRPRHRASRASPGHRVRGVGPGRPRGQRGRRLQLLGRPPARDALAGLERHLGAVPPRRRGRAQRYKYEILTPDGELLLKADPYAQETELPPKTASVISTPGHEWSEEDASASPTRAESEPLAEPMSIYEVHLGSWRLNSLEDNRPLTYPELADELSAYVAGHGLHPRRAAAGHGAPVRRLVGLPGHRLLRPDPALRLARRPARVRRPAARQRASA